MIDYAAALIGRSLCLCLLGVALTNDVDSRAADLNPASAADQRMSEGNAFMSQGDFARASEALRKAAALYDASGQQERRMQALLHFGTACQRLGHHKLALTTFSNTLHLAEHLGARPTRIAALSALGVTQALLRETNQAQANLALGLALAKQDGEVGAVADLLNNLGNLSATRREYAEAVQCYQESADAAHRGGRPLLAGQALANAALASMAGGHFVEAESFNQQSLEAIGKLDSSHDQATLYATVGRNYRALALKRSSLDEGFLSQADRALQLAQASAEKIGDHLLLADALGNLASLEMLRGHPDEALPLTRRAIFHARQANSADALYRWEWQSARLLKAQGETDAAISAYRRAVESFQDIRQDIALGHGNHLTGVLFDHGEESFEERAGALFFELADLVLRKADSLAGSGQEQKWLEEALQTIESLRSAELDDYLQDQCVRLQRSRVARVESLPGAAVLYIIPFTNRTELLVGLPGPSRSFQLKRFAVPVAKTDLTNTTARLRHLLETRGTWEFRTPAHQLYQWLIAPIALTLDTHGIDTLVLVPDGALRTIPAAALHDGKRFLVERYAVAVSPGLMLMEPKRMGRRRVSLLLGALSEEAQGNPGLPYVMDEVENIRRTFSSTVLANRSFLTNRLSDEFKQGRYSIVHLASHGQFDRDAKNSFVWTYDGKLDLDDLERLIRPKQYRGQPVELLALSACQTAMGDDRAALGLAGVAVKSGARSALATLWNVNDKTSSRLVSEFYDQLRKNRSLSKAKALQAAQLLLLREPGSHPCHWSPYLIIGNWL